MTDFEKLVLDKLKKVPRGKVTAYGMLARAVGKSKAARAVGNALNKNPWAPKVPCHRVVRSDGKIGEYEGGVAKKIFLLEKEGVKVDKNKIEDFNEIRACLKGPYSTANSKFRLQKPHRSSP